MTAQSSEKLAQVLHAAGLFELEKRARANEFHDFLSDDPLCAITLDNELAKIIREGDERQRMAASNIRQRHHEGEFDATLAESDDWAASPDGQDAMRRLMKGE